MWLCGYGVSHHPSAARARECNRVRFTWFVKEIAATENCGKSYSKTKLKQVSTGYQYELTLFKFEEEKPNLKGPLIPMGMICENPQI